MLFQGKNDEYLRIEKITKSNCTLLKKTIESSLTLLWTTDNQTTLVIDNQEYLFEENQIVCLTEFHQVAVKQINQVNMVRFNRSFYCILDHDAEVSCKGILFFGASQLPIITLPTAELEKYKTLWKMFVLEMESKDNLQLQMLQMMLKRLLILCTRLYKTQHNYKQLENGQVDIVRQYNFLVEQHFRHKHSVSDYAELLHKSPKTIANIFSKLGKKTPLQYIQQRILLEAQRLLRYTDKPVKEVAYELGYDDLQSFSRFFKKQEQLSPSKYREKN